MGFQRLFSNRRAFMGTDELFSILKVVLVVIVVLAIIVAIGKFLFGIQLFG